MNDMASHLTHVTVPFSDRPVRPVLRGAPGALAQEQLREDTWTITLPESEYGLELDLPLGQPEAFLLPGLSFSAEWLPPHGTAFSADSLLCTGAGLAPWFRLELSVPARFLLNRRADHCLLRLQIGETAGRPVRISGTTGPNAAAPGLFPPLDRATANSEAARAILDLFALLHTIEPACLGNPTHNHRTTLAALSERRRSFLNLSPILDLEIFEAPIGGRAVGYAASWPERQLLVLNGPCPDRQFPAGAPFWLLLGAGDVRLEFSQDCKGLTVETFDCYGRPRSLQGARSPGSRRLALAPGEQIAVKTC